MNKRIEIYSFIAGAVFLISGFAKSIDSALFAQTITQYGFGDLWFMAPIIIIVELYLGLNLILNLNQRLMAAISTIFVVLLTGIFLYGWLAQDVTDCGCFGPIKVLSSSPWISLLRNAILLYLCIDVWINTPREPINTNWVINSTFILVLCLAAFMSGYTSRTTSGTGASLKMISTKPVALSENKLSDFIETSPDSTYLVFAFSYQCPHCFNSMENLKQYEEKGAVDKVIGLTIRNSRGRKFFEDYFNPQFTIKEYRPDSLLELTNQFPTIYYVRNDSIVEQMQGELPAALFFMKERGIDTSHLYAVLETENDTTNVVAIDSDSIPAESTDIQ